MFNLLLEYKIEIVTDLKKFHFQKKWSVESTISEDIQEMMKI